MKNNKFKNLLNIGLGLASKKISEKQKKEHEKIIAENKRKFVEAYEKEFGGESIEGREPLSFDKDGDK